MIRMNSIYNIVGLILMLCTSFVMTACNKDEVIINTDEDKTENSNGNETVIPEGYFVANLMPASENVFSRALVTGNSTAIQSLRFLIFKKETETDGTAKYVYFDPDKEYTEDNLKYNEVVFQSDGSYNQSHTWPLQEGFNTKVILPNGDYKVVFLGNMMDNQFVGQTETSKIVNLGDGTYESVRINFPDAGPLAFFPTLSGSPEGYYQNAFYMGEAEFSSSTPSPYVVLQRLISQNCFSRELIDTDMAVTMLVQSIVDQIKDGNLSTDVVRGVLSTKITEILKPILSPLLIPVTTVVDRLVNILLGDLVNLLHEAVLKKVTTLVENLLKADENTRTKAGQALYDVLNPWSDGRSVNAQIAMVSSIDLNRRVRGTKDPIMINNIPVKNVLQENTSGAPPTFTITSLNGPFTLIEATVNDDDDGTLKKSIGVLRPALSGIDENVLAGLLINIKTSISYTQESNQSYSTMYDLLRLRLTDPSLTEQKITLDIELSKIIDADKLTSAILGDGLLSGLLTGVVKDVVEKLVNGLLGSDTDGSGSLLSSLDLRLPKIAIDNISIDGRWGNTVRKDMTIIPSEIGTYNSQN